MTRSDYAQRFSGIERLYGKDAPSIIQNLHLCVVGLGGVGSWAVEALARTGVGEITMIDYDVVALSNVNRQLHALTPHIDRKKYQVLTERIIQIHPGCRCHTLDDYINMENLDLYLNKKRGYHYVIDAIDSIKFKAAMIYYCKRNKIPIVTTGGAGGGNDPTAIKVLDLSRTYNDALAAKVRSKLRADFGFTKNPRRTFGVECVFSSQQKAYPRSDGSVGHEKPGVAGVHLDCRFGYGAATFVTATFGMVAASRAINKTLKKMISV